MTMRGPEGGGGRPARGGGGGGAGRGGARGGDGAATALALTFASVFLGNTLEMIVRWLGDAGYVNALLQSLPTKWRDEVRRVFTADHKTTAYLVEGGFETFVAGLLINVPEPIRRPIDDFLQAVFTVLREVATQPNQDAMRKHWDSKTPELKLKLLEIKSKKVKPTFADIFAKLGPAGRTLFKTFDVALARTNVAFYEDEWKPAKERMTFEQLFETFRHIGFTPIAGLAPDELLRRARAIIAEMNVTNTNAKNQLETAMDLALGIETPSTARITRAMAGLDARVDAFTGRQDARHQEFIQARRSTHVPTWLLAIVMIVVGLWLMNKIGLWNPMPTVRAILESTDAFNPFVWLFDKKGVSP